MQGTRRIIRRVKEQATKRNKKEKKNVPTNLDARRHGVVVTIR
jgi:hypothetical protein